MATIEVTDQSFHETVKQGIVLLDWWAPWCGPCRAFAPIYEQTAKKHPDIVFGKVNTEAEGRLAGTFGIRSIPTLMIFRDDILIFSQPGMVPAAALEDLIRQTRALDMDEVRRKVAAEEATEKAAAGESRQSP